MKRVTIYVDEKDWKDVKNWAWAKDISIGTYLIGLHKATKISDNGTIIVKRDCNGEIISITHEEHPDSVPIKMKEISKKALKKNAGVIEKLKNKWVNPLTGSMLAPKA